MCGIRFDIIIMTTGKARTRAGVRIAAIALLIPCTSVALHALAGNSEFFMRASKCGGSRRASRRTPCCLLQTRDSYLWIGTKGGLSRFDGVRFTTFDDRNKQQLKENEIWALAEGSDASLWIGTYGGGLSRLKDGKFTIYTTADGLVSDFVASLRTDDDGGVWIGTDGGLSRFKDGRFTQLHREERARRTTPFDGCTAIRTAACGSAPSAAGSTESRDGRIVTERIEGTGAATRRSPRSIATGSGTLWIGALDGLFRVKDGTIDALHHRRRPVLQHGFASSPRIPTASCGSGRRNGLVRYEHGVFTAYHVRGRAARRRSF